MELSTYRGGNQFGLGRKNICGACGNTGIVEVEHNGAKTKATCPACGGANRDSSDQHYPNGLK